MNTIAIVVLALAFVAAPVLVSYVVESLRRRPTSPTSTAWGPGISVTYGSRRYASEVSESRARAEPGSPP